MSDVYVLECRGMNTFAYLWWCVLNENERSTSGSVQELYASVRFVRACMRLPSFWQYWTMCMRV